MTQDALRVLGVAYRCDVGHAGTAKIQTMHWKRTWSLSA